MRRYLNLLHWFLYKMHYQIHMLFKRINPFRLIRRLPFQKKRHQRLGIDIDQEIDKAFGHKEYGFSVLFAGGALVGIVFLFFVSLTIFLLKVIALSKLIGLVYFILVALFSYLLCHLLVFSKDKYLDYFKQYEQYSSQGKLKLAFINFVFIILVLSLFVLSLQFEL